MLCNIDENGNIVMAIPNRKLTPTEWSLVNNVSRETTYRMLRSGRLKAEKVGRQWRIDPDALPSN